MKSFFFILYNDGIVGPANRNKDLTLLSAITMEENWKMDLRPYYPVAIITVRLHRPRPTREQSAMHVNEQGKLVFNPKPYLS